MNIIDNKTLIYFGLGFGFSRILIGQAISMMNIESGYFPDIFIFAYLYVCLIFINIKKIFSFSHLVARNLVISIISIVVNDIFLLIFRSHSFNLLNRSITGAYILVLALLSSTCYHLTQHFLKVKLKSN